MKARLFLAFMACLLLCSTPAAAQKIKYKNLFPLLDAKNWEQAAPLLQAFLQKEPEHPNANFQMAKYQEHLANQAHAITDTLFDVRLDSAQEYYKKAYGLITEKELRKRDEYYQVYNRRDLRTGKFGIKLSDVQLDIERKQEYLAKLKTLGQQARTALDSVQQAYAANGQLSDSLNTVFDGNLNHLYLRGEALLPLMERYIMHDKVLARNWAIYRQAIEQLPGAEERYQQDVKVLEPLPFEESLYEAADFLAPYVSYTNFTAWARQTKQVVTKEIVPMNEALIAADRQLEALLRDVEEQKYRTQDAPQGLDPKGLAMQVMQKYDKGAESMPVLMLEAKMAEIKARRFADTVFTPALQDTSNIYKRQALHKEIVSQYSMASRNVQAVRGQNLGQEMLKYGSYLTARYEGLAPLQEYLTKRLTLTFKAAEAWQNKAKAYQQTIDWIVLADEGDSIPAFLVPQDFEEGQLSYITTDSLMLPGDSLLLSGIYYDQENGQVAWMLSRAPNGVVSWKHMAPVQTYNNADAGTDSVKRAQPWSTLIMLPQQGQVAQTGLMAVQCVPNDSCQAVMQVLGLADGAPGWQQLVKLPGMPAKAAVVYQPGSTESGSELVDIMMADSSAAALKVNKEGVLPDEEEEATEEQKE